MFSQCTLKHAVSFSPCCLLRRGLLLPLWHTTTLHCQLPCALYSTLLSLTQLCLLCLGLCPSAVPHALLPPPPGTCNTFLTIWGAGSLRMLMPFDVILQCIGLQCQLLAAITSGSLPGEQVPLLSPRCFPAVRIVKRVLNESAPVPRGSRLCNTLHHMYRVKLLGYYLHWEKGVLTLALPEQCDVVYLYLSFGVCQII